MRLLTKQTDSHLEGTLTPGSLYLILSVFFILANLVAFLQTFAATMAFLHYFLPYFGIVKMTHEISHAVGILAPVITSYIGHKKLSFR